MRVAILHDNRQGLLGYGLDNHRSPVQPTTDPITSGGVVTNDGGRIGVGGWRNCQDRRHRLRLGAARLRP
jgi:hypothetical protein